MLNFTQLPMANESQGRISAQQLRERGNAALASGRIMKANKWFSLAVQLDPNDYESVYKLARVRYEQGLYTDALAYALEAIRLEKNTGNRLTSSDDVEDLKTPLPAEEISQKAESSESHLQKHINNFEETQDVVVEIERAQEQNTETKALLIQSLNLSEEHVNIDKAVQTRRHWQHVLNYVPRFKPTLLASVSPYCPLNNEAATSLITPTIRDAARLKPTQLAFLSGGYNDARHLFITLIDANNWETEKNGPKHRYHFTMVDSMPHSAARLAVFCYLLMTPPNQDNADVAALVVAMAFATSRMPQFIYNFLVGAIKVVRESLERDGTVPRCPFLWIPTSSITGIAKCLKCWEEEKPYQRNPLPLDCQDPDQPHIPDAIVWNAAGIVRITDFMLSMYDNPFAHILVEFVEEGFKLPNKVEEFQTLIEKTWIINPFWWDATVSPSLNRLTPDRPPRAAYLLTQNFASLCRPDVPNHRMPVISVIEKFFEKVGKALRALQKRLVIEVLTAELDETCERMCLKHLPHRANGTMAGRPDLDTMGFPWVYDHIHCSNIPMYTGGVLPMMRHYLPLLKHAHQSVVSALLSRDSESTLPLPSVVAEFAALHSPDLLYSMSGAAVDDDSEAVRIGGRVSKLKNSETTWYFSWWRTRDVPKHLGTNANSSSRQQARDLPAEKLVLPRRAQFERWAITLFWRIAAPTVQRLGQDLKNPSVKVMPENMCSFLRILDFARVHAGFPTDWINGVLSSILSGKPVISAVTSRRLFMTPKEAVGPKTKVHCSDSFGMISTTNTSFCTAELSTMLAIWQPILSWEVALTSQQPQTTLSIPPTQEIQPATTAVIGCPGAVLLPPLSGIGRYSVTITGIDCSESLSAPHHALVLFDRLKLGSPVDMMLLLEFAHPMGCSVVGDVQEDEEKEQIKGGEVRKKRRKNRGKNAKGIKKETNKVKQGAKQKGGEGGNGAAGSGESDDGSGRGEGGSEADDSGFLSGASSVTAIVETPQFAIDDITGAFHVVTVFDWKWDDVEARTGMATWWMRADVMDAIRSDPEKEGHWELCLWSTSIRKCLNHNFVSTNNVTKVGMWETLFDASNNDNPPPSCNPETYYFAAPVAEVPDSFPPPNGASWAEDFVV